MFSCLHLFLVLISNMANSSDSHKQKLSGVFNKRSWQLKRLRAAYIVETRISAIFLSVDYLKMIVSLVEHLC